jgi:Bacteriophage head to tail connecting protein
MLLSRLPAGLEDAAALLKRRASAEKRKNLWRALYRDAYLYAMPGRETFTWHTEGQYRNNRLFDSTLQEATYTASNTACALLFPSWMEWMQLAPGAAMTAEQMEKNPEILAGLQQATKTFFGYLNASNFNQVISEAALDLQVGTAALTFDEGDSDNPFVFESIPTSCLELEEGPNGTIETKFLEREFEARNLLRMYPGMELFDLPEATRKIVQESPDTKIKVIQGEIYEPESKKYFGVVLDLNGPTIIWRYDYGKSCPMIVARASKTAGETYGRGRVLLALSDARTLDRMQEFVLSQAALSIAPPLTGVSDGVLNPYTASLTPNTIIPVASNADGSPSLKPIELGQNFNITEQMMKDLRERVRRILLGPEPSEGPVKSATEISVQDRNRLWAMNGEYSRVQVELIGPVVRRGVFILQKKGLMPRFRLDGRSVAVKWTSPFATTQNAEDMLAFQKTIQTLLQMGPQIGTAAITTGIKVKEVPAYIARLNGMPEKLIMTDADREELTKQVTQAGLAAQGNQVQHAGNMAAATAGGEAAGGAPPGGAPPPQALAA